MFEDCLNFEKGKKVESLRIMNEKEKKLFYDFKYNNLNLIKIENGFYNYFIVSLLIILRNFRMFRNDISIACQKNKKFQNKKIN